MKLSSFRPIVLMTAACLSGTVALIPEVHATPRFEAIQAFERHPSTPAGRLISDTAGNFYGTSSGGAYGCGTVFKISPDGTVTTLRDFDVINDDSPGNELTAGADGNFYGISTRSGSGAGHVFRITPTGDYSVVYAFDGGADGGNPESPLVLSPRDGNFYGYTTSGGANELGTFFRLTPAGVITTLYSWGRDAVGSAPTGNIALGRDGNFYGICGTSTNDGCASIWRITSGGAVSSIANFASIPNMRYALPSSLMQGSDGNFYGTTSAGGPGDGGTVYKVSQPGTITLIAEFYWHEHIRPSGVLVEAADGMLYGTTSSGGEHMSGQVFRIGKSGGFVPLAEFNRLSKGPAYPLGGLTLLPDGSFVGLTYEGGSYHSGAAYRMSASGEVSMLASLKGDFHSRPESKLMLASDGSFHGRIAGGHTFKVTPQGELSTFTQAVDGASGFAYNPGFVEGDDGTIYGFEPYSSGTAYGYLYTLNAQHERQTFFTFDETTGGNPNSLIKGSDGNLYGSTRTGGSLNGGTIYKIDSTGLFTLLAEFDITDRYQPGSGLVRTADGTIYGTTESGGAEESGSIFKLSPDGVLTTLIDVTNAEVNGRNPVSGPMQASDGNLYGVLREGGPSYVGTIYKITPAGEMTTLHAFNISDGAYPVGQLTEGPDGAFYGATYAGGTVEAAGTLFRITQDGAFTTIFNFDRFNGSIPVAGLTADLEGSLYGTTMEGGFTPDGRPAGGGVIFRILFGAEVETGAATEVATTTATLNATVNPGGYPTTVTFQYGTSPDLSSFSSISTATIPAGTEAVNVQALVSGLNPETTYYFRAVAVNDETPELQAGDIASFQTTEPAEIVVETASGRVLSNGSILSFGLVSIASPETLTLTIRNASDTAPLTGVGATLSGGGAGHFAVTGVPAATVPGSSSTSCAVRFAPTSLGLKSAKLTITSSDPDESPLEVNVYGIALPRILGGLLKNAH